MTMLDEGVIMFLGTKHVMLCSWLCIIRVKDRQCIKHLKMEKSGDF